MSLKRVTMIASLITSGYIERKKQIRKEARKEGRKEGEILWRWILIPEAETSSFGRESTHEQDEIGGGK